jgi:multiple sugar transport system ATP-binding protein
LAEVIFDHVEKAYPNGYRAVSDLNLHIEDGEFLVMVGPSGCGKSTTLRMIAGLEDITGGALSIDGNVVNDIAAKDRDIAMVFQNYALYPHMSVADNIAFPLKLHKVPKDEIKRRVQDVARILELGEYLNRKPAQLSGGQRQRVAMGRAMVRQPKVFLLDEPLSNLDAKLRVQTRGEIHRIQREVNVTTFYVTHDQVEAMTMADRVAVINRGILQQVDNPQVLYDDPDNTFVATFIGSPSMSLMSATLDGVDEGLVVRIGSQTLALPADIAHKRPALPSYVGRRIIVGLRPDAMEDAALVPEHPADRRLRGEVDAVEALGFERIVYFGIDAEPIIEKDALDVENAEAVASSKAGARLSGRFDPASRVRNGDQAEVAVRTDQAHFFDADTNLAIRG